MEKQLEGALDSGGSDKRRKVIEAFRERSPDRPDRCREVPEVRPVELSE
jgi:hypothetical protein